MNKLRRQRVIKLALATSGVLCAVTLAAVALRKNINLYLTPHELAQAAIHPQQVIRLGGMVERGSVHFAKDTLKITFSVTDFKGRTQVIYRGILPALFREGQGIVAQGQLIKPNVLLASQVLAKHDENYMPPGIIKERRHYVR